MTDFRTFWEHLPPHLTTSLLLVEQPFSRDIALTAATAADLTKWSSRPPKIIDESGGALDSLPTALASGYVGMSPKNCKGVFAGIANACLVALRDRSTAGHIISAEDLATIGPVSLLQDLAVVATLGISHVERNGHHYFRGLSMMPAALNESVLVSQGDLYRRLDNGVATLDIERGAISMNTLLHSPFGYSSDLSSLSPLTRPLASFDPAAELEQAGPGQRVYQ